MEETTYDVEAGLDTKALGLKTLATAVRTAKGFAANAAIGAAAKVYEVRGDARKLVDKYALVKGRVRKIEFIPE